MTNIGRPRFDERIVIRKKDYFYGIYIGDKTVYVKAKNNTPTETLLSHYREALLGRGTIYPLKYMRLYSDTGSMIAEIQATVSRDNTMLTITAPYSADTTVTIKRVKLVAEDTQGGKYEYFDMQLEVPVSLSSGETIIIYYYINVGEPPRTTSSNLSFRVTTTTWLAERIAKMLSGEIASIDIATATIYDDHDVEGPTANADILSNGARFTWTPSENNPLYVYYILVKNSGGETIMRIQLSDMAVINAPDTLEVKIMVQ